MKKIKYPRTPYLPWAPGLKDQEDDPKVVDLNNFVGRDIVITAKMDGECTSLYRDAYHARSLDSGSHPSRDYVKRIWGGIKHNIPEAYRVCGENLFAKHSIYYTDLEDYFQVFSVWNDDYCLSWQATKAFCQYLGLITVPILWQGRYDEKFLMTFHERLDLTQQEGYVIRVVDGFVSDCFDQCVAKWARLGHIQTDDHWLNQPLVKNKLRSKV